MASNQKAVESVDSPATDPDLISESAETDMVAGYEIPTEITHNYLVDLIHQPAWKTILLDIVKSEKMDPWNIDIIVLADSYLQKIQSLEKANLRVPANAILATAILLKYKSKTLHLTSLDELDKEEAEKELSPEERQLLAESIPDLRGTRLMREGRVTLDSLVQTIETMLSKSQASSRFARKLEELRFVMPDASFNVEEKMKSLREKISQRMDSQGLVLFSRLVVEFKDNPIEIVNTFIPLLFLANRGEIAIWQEAFWEDIFIRWNKSEQEK